MTLLLSLQKKHGLTINQRTYLLEVLILLRMLNQSKGRIFHADHYREKLELCLSWLKGKQWP